MYVVGVDSEGSEGTRTWAVVLQALALVGDRLTYLPALPDRHLFSHLIARPRPVLGEATRLCTLILKMLGT